MAAGPGTAPDGPALAASRDRPVARRIALAVLAVLLGLLTLWAFVSYLEPVFTGEQAGELLKCN